MCFSRVWIARLALWLAAWCLVSWTAAAQDGSPAKPDSADAAGQPPGPGGGPPREGSPAKLGLLVNEPGALQGYTLLSPLHGKKTYLIDMQGRVVHTWQSQYTPALTAYLLENGDLLRPGAIERKPEGLAGPGAGGRIQKFTWDGELIWDYEYASSTRLQHHDVTPLPNGNVLAISWDKKTSAEAIAAGRRPESVGDGGLLPDCILELKPTGKTSAEVVWEWHVWDHLIQDLDSSKANFGEVAAHPELVDVNFGGEGTVGAMMRDPGGVDRLRAIGYLGNSNDRRPPRGNPDWTHFNSVAYNPQLDQIVVSVHSFSEIWIIDHSTTTQEAAGHTGGRSAKGGDLLYRWGNPQAYRAGKPADQTLFSQHNAHWIPPGLSGAGHLLVFNNGGRRPGGDYSSVDELELPVDEQGKYQRAEGSAFGPKQALWSYSDPQKKSDFYSMLISGAQRLANGNTLICSGISGVVFEVTASQQTVWKYVNPTKNESGPGGPGRPGGPGGPGGPGPGGPGGFEPPKPGRILVPFVQDALKLSDDQRKQLETAQKEVDAELEKLLTDEQRKQLAQPQGFGPGRFFGALPQPGQLLSASQKGSLKLNDQQKEQLDALQKSADEKLAQLLVEEQKKQIQQMREGFARGGFARGGPGRPGGPPGFGPPGPSSLFRAYRYTADHPALAGKELKPGQTLVAIAEAEAKEREAKEREARERRAKEGGEKSAAQPDKPPAGGAADAKPR